MLKDFGKNRPLRIVLIYFFIGLVLLFNVEYLILIFVKNIRLLAFLELSKTLVFLIVTAVLLYLMISRYENQLLNTIKKLKSSNKDLRMFFYRIQHDLRSPLASTLGLTDLAIQEENNENTSLYLEKIQESTHKMDHILGALLDLSVVLDNKKKVEEFSIKALITSVKKKIKTIEGYKEVKVVFETEGNDGFHSDSKILQAVLENLIQNSIQYRDISRSESLVLIKMINSEDALNIVVNDNGTGISAEHVKKVFEIFYRGTSEGSGTGLGLYIVKLAVDKLNGSITLESKVNDGTKFIIEIPSAE